MSEATLRHGDYVATVVYDAEEDMLRGNVINTSSHIDFFADSVEGLKQEFATSIEVYLDVCKDHGIAPERGYSGKFNLRLDPTLHARVALEAVAEGVSINTWVAAAIRDRIIEVRGSAPVAAISKKQS